MSTKLEFIKFSRKWESASILGNKRISESYHDWMAGKYRWYVKDSEGVLHEGSEDTPEAAPLKVLSVLRELYPDHEIQERVWSY